LFLGTCVFMASCLVSSASAATINWTDMSDLIDGVTTIIPSFGNLIFAVIPLILVVAVASFALGLFDSILDGISSAFRSFGRK